MLYVSSVPWGPLAAARTWLATSPMSPVLSLDGVLVPQPEVQTAECCGGTKTLQLVCWYCGKVSPPLIVPATVTAKVLFSILITPRRRSPLASRQVRTVTPESTTPPAPCSESTLH